MKVLIIYSCSGYPVQSTFLEHLYSFRKYSKNKVYYLNFFFRQRYKLLKLIDFDLVIFHQSFTAPWETEESYRNKVRIVASVLKKNTLKVAFFQDEFFQTNLTVFLINHLKITHVFTVAPKSEIKKIYHGLSHKVIFHQTLTGYISDEKIEKIQKLSHTTRTIDIGYRTAWNNAYVLGSFGLNKKLLSEVFFKKSKNKRLNIDVSSHQKDMYLGDSWFKFLLQCKYVLGVESGSSMLDRNGSIAKRIQAYLMKNPGASFQDVKARCFSKEDGNLKLCGMSPRHLEACITKTCQLLVEGKYNGILKAWKHYIPIKKDFSNLDKIIQIVKKDTLRDSITKRAYHDIVESKKYSYQMFIAEFYKTATKQKKDNTVLSSLDRILYDYYAINDYITWVRAYIRSIFNRMKI